MLSAVASNAAASAKPAVGQPESRIRVWGALTGSVYVLLHVNGREISFRCRAIITPRGEANVSVGPHHPEPAHAAGGLAGLGQARESTGNRTSPPSLSVLVRGHYSFRAFKLLTFLVSQCHDDRIFIDAKELGHVVVGITED
jgi:hypothetical protein